MRRNRHPDPLRGRRVIKSGDHRNLEEVIEEEQRREDFRIDGLTDALHRHNLEGGLYDRDDREYGDAEFMRTPTDYQANAEAGLAREMAGNAGKEQEALRKWNEDPKAVTDGWWDDK